MRGSKVIEYKSRKKKKNYEGFSLTLWSIGLAEKLAGPQLVKKFPSVNPKFHYRIHKSPPPVVSQIDPIHAPFNFLKSILILSCHLRLGI
jgi:hypothetical protein